MKITPQFIVTFETELKGLVTSNWDRVSANLVWDRFMKVRPSSTKTEILTWLLETAQIYPEGDGGNKRFDDMVAATMTYENAHAGAALELTRDEIEDNQMKDNPTVGALDYASKWAKDIGAAAAYEPQKQLAKLILNGGTDTCYDGHPFFYASHPINPNGGGGTYSNLIDTVPIDFAHLSGSSEQDKLLEARRNLGKAVATVRKARFFNNVPRYLVPTTLAVRSDEYDYANMVVNAGIIGQTSNTSAVDPKNPSRRLEVIAMPELDDAAAGTYWIGVEDLLSDELGGFVWSEREAFFMRTFGPMDEAVLARMNLFQWLMDGRNTSLYGHPYMFYQCNPT